MISPTEEQINVAFNVTQKAYIQARDAFRVVEKEMDTETGVSLSSMKYYNLANKEYDRCHKRFLQLTNLVNKARWAKREKYD